MLFTNTLWHARVSDDPDLDARYDAWRALHGMNETVEALRSQTQELDCDPNANSKDEYANGCAPKYTRNTGTACPATAPALWSSSQPRGAGPFNCVPLQTGTSTNLVTSLAQRILGGNGNVCTAGRESHWSSYPNLPDGDTRIVSLFIVPPSSTIGGSGNAVVPVIDFATLRSNLWTPSVKTRSSRRSAVYVLTMRTPPSA